MANTSIQANLRRNGLKKKASERTWREWDAIYDFEREEVSYLKRASIGLLLLGIAFGMLLTMFTYQYFGTTFSYSNEPFIICDVSWKYDSSEK